MDIFQSEAVLYVHVQYRQQLLCAETQLHYRLSLEMLHLDDVGLDNPSTLDKGFEV